MFLKKNVKIACCCCLFQIGKLCCEFRVLVFNKVGMVKFVWIIFRSSVGLEKSQLFVESSTSVNVTDVSYIWKRWRQHSNKSTWYQNLAEIVSFRMDFVSNSIIAYLDNVISLNCLDNYLYNQFLAVIKLRICIFGGS